MSMRLRPMGRGAVTTLLNQPEFSTRHRPHGLTADPHSQSWDYGMLAVGRQAPKRASPEQQSHRAQVLPKLTPQISH